MDYLFIFLFNYSLPYENEETKEDSCLVREVEGAEKAFITTNAVDFQSIQNNGDIHSKSRTPPPRALQMSDNNSGSNTIMEAGRNICSLEFEHGNILKTSQNLDTRSVVSKRTVTARSHISSGSEIGKQGKTEED